MNPFRPFALIAVAAACGLATAQLRTEVYATGFSLPVCLTQDPTNPDVQFVVEQRGRVRPVVNGVVQPDFLNLAGIVHQTHSEGGLLGLAFHPNYATNRFFFVYYTDTSGDSHVARYTRNAANPLLADPGSAQQVIFIDQPFSNHNGGTIRFGPNDGYLYIGMGDGGSGNDPGNRAQTITNMLLGKFLRINVDADDFPADPNKNYSVPPTNPFVGATGDDEIWSFGVRNPWKWSFDDPTKLGTGGMLIGDVGQNAWEEVDYEQPLAGGRNYGWRQYEGNHLTGNGGGVGPPYWFPIHEYSHSFGISVTGGYVYRGLLLGDYFGRYFFADYGSTRVWSFLLVTNAQGEGSAIDLVEHTADLAHGAQAVSSIDVDSKGELFLLDYRGSGQGRVLRVMPENRAWVESVAPVFLTRTQGDPRGLSALDGKFFLTRAGLITSAGLVFRSTILVNMRTDAPAPSFFDLTLDFGGSQLFNPGGLEVSMRNWTTGDLEVVANLPVTFDLVMHQINDIPAANYRRADGAVQIQLQAATTGFLISPGTTLRYDRLKLAVR